MEIFVAFLWALFQSSASVLGELDLKELENVKCSKSAIDYNVTLSLGMKAGKFSKDGKATSMTDCVRNCCDVNTCDAAFMANDQCFLVSCYSMESCVAKQQKNPSYRTMLSFVMRPVKDVGDTSSDGGAEPAIEEELAEAVPWDSNPFILEKPSARNLVSSDPYEKYRWLARHKRSDVFDLVLAIGCGMAAVCVGVGGVIMMTQRLLDNRGVQKVSNYRVE